MDAVVLLIALLIVIPIGYAAYRKYRFEEQETWRRMPAGDDEEVIPPEG
ncbi:MAG: hypothetical protein HZC41_03875 [Chloroflexi bacterium]|nr:hypothetical protein [Chloroflexota bacterium]